LLIFLGVLFFVLAIAPEVSYYYTNFGTFFVILIQTFFGLSIPILFVIPLYSKAGTSVKEMPSIKSIGTDNQLSALYPR
jgi:hypothetical protein